MRKRLAILSLAMVLAIGSVLAPFSRAAYANTIAIEAGAYALFTVLGLFGFNVGDDAIADPAAAWGEFTGWMDGLAADVVDEARSTARASNPDFVNNALDWDDGGKEAIQAQFLDWGKSGTINLDGLSIMAQGGALGLLPFVLSLFMADHLTAGDMNGVYIGNGEWSMALNVGNASYVTHGLNGINPSVNHPIASWYSTAGVLNVYTLQKVAGAGLSFFAIGFDSAGNSNSTAVSGFTLRNEAGGNTAIIWEYDSSKGKFVAKSNGLRYSVHFSVLPGQSVTDPRILTGLGAIEAKMFGAVGTVDFDTGIWDLVFPDSVVTDNPDVIGGSDYWDDAKENKDILNPAAGAAVIGNDLVIDGDYVANRGSLGVITDWGDINSWVDALAHAGAGVATGELDGTIPKTNTGMAVDVGTGELVTDAVGDLVKPDSGTSLDPNKNNKGRNPNDWKIPIDLSKYFPFCIPFDIIALFEKLGSGASTFSFEPFDAPAFDAPFKVDGVIDENIHLDFADWGNDGKHSHA